MILDVLSWILLGAGSAVLVLAGLAILRMPTFYTRLHAAAVNETLAPLLILLGLTLQAGDLKDGLGAVEVVVKLGLVLLFLFVTSPVASHALAKAALENGVLPGAYRRRQENGADEAQANGDGGAAP